MSIQIYILSELMKGNNYPYRLKKQLSEPIPLDQLGGLTESKLYYNFESLVKQGLIEPVEIIKEEHRPDKQVFGITAKGREELPKKIYGLFEHSNSITDMMLALANINYVDRAQVVHIIETKLNAITAHSKQLEEYRNLVQISKENENLVQFISGYITSKSEHTVHWLEELLEWIQQEKL